MVGNSPGSADLGPKVFFVWGSFCTLSLLFAYFFVPEMKGLTLEQVDKMMEEVTARKSAAWIPHVTFVEEMRRINAAKAAGAPMAPPMRAGGGGQLHRDQYDEPSFGRQQSFRQHARTTPPPPPQYYSHTPPPPQQWQHSPPPQHYQQVPPPHSWQYTPPPQEPPRHPYQRQNPY